MDSKDMIDLRNKRLSYYNKIIASNVFENEPEDNSSHQKDFFPISNTPDPDFPENKPNLNRRSSLYTGPPDSIQFLNQFFDENQQANPMTTPPQNEQLMFNNNKHSNFIRKCSSSISIDESSSQASTARYSSNRKLEEFKRVVENSYNQHVMNRKVESPATKPPIHQQISTTTTTTEQSQNDETLENSSNKNIFLNFNRAESIQSIDTSFTDQTPLQTDRLPEGDSKTKQTKAYEIPYMSAYNIYDKKNVPKSNSNENIGDSDDVQLDHQIVKQKQRSTNDRHVIMEKYFNSFETNNNNSVDNHNLQLNRRMSIDSHHNAIQRADNNNTNLSNNKKHLSSTGSSINTSPTSQSSVESSNTKKQLNDFVQNSNPKPDFTPTPPGSSNPAFLQQTSHHEVKPPETPRTRSAASTYRRNLLLNQQQQQTKTPTPTKHDEKFHKTDDLKDFIEKKRSDYKSSSSINSENEPKAKPDAQQLKQSIKLDHFFSSAPKAQNSNPQKPSLLNTKKTRKFKKNIFNMMENYEHLDRSDEDNDLDDTFDIFSSQESLNDADKCKITKNVPEPNNLKKFDLKIDLGELSADEDTQIEQKNKLQFQNDEIDEDSVVHISNFKAESSRKPQKKQVKPEIIPMLDLLDDDKSQSVAASLAISMCKEIDYQKEMEVIYELQKKELNNEVQAAETPKSAKQKKQKNQIKLNKLKTNMPPSMSYVSATSSRITSPKPLTPKTTTNNNSNFSTNTKTIPSFNTMKVTKQEFKPQQRPSSASANNLETIIPLKFDKKPDRPDLYRPSSVASISINKPSNDSIKSSRPDTKKPTKNAKQINKKSFLNPKLKKLHSLASLQRSNSRMENEMLENEDPIQQQSQPPSSKDLFLSFSKLVALESNLQNETENEKIIKVAAQKRPRTAYAKLEMSTVNLNDLEQDSHKKPANIPVIEAKVIEKQDDNAVGNQEDYKNLFQNNEEDQTNEPNWLHLPDEIWLNILGYLSQNELAQFGLTCKKFQKLYVDGTLWKKISMKYQYNMCDEWLYWIGKRRPNELNIVQCSGIVSLNAIAEMFKKIGNELQILNLSRCSNGSLSGDNFALQASIRCPNVTCLDLSWTLLSNQTLKLISESFNKIESINLSGCNMIQEEGLNCLLTTHGETLKTLEISGCLQFSSMAVFNIGAYCRNLIRLNISNCHRITNESIMEASQQWLHLKFLDLRGIKNIRNNCVSTLIRKCISLEGLALGECIHLSDAAVLEISTYKSGIKYLDLNGCKKITDNSLRSLANFCTKLEFLNIKATNVNDSGIMSLTNGKCAQSLVELNLSYLPVGEIVLAKLLRSFTSLKVLHLYGCFKIRKLDEIKSSLKDFNKNLVINV